MELQKLENYDDLLILAGAEVLNFEQFGSYQGDWIAKVIYKDQKGYIKDYYGSCSGCDALQSEFSWSSHDHIDNNYYNPLWDGFAHDCEICQQQKVKAIELGKSYLDNIITYEECLQLVSENLKWDMSAQEMIDWLKNIGS